MTIRVIAGNAEFIRIGKTLNIKFTDINRPIAGI